MVEVKKTYPIVKVIKKDETISVVMDKRTIKITTPALQGIAGPSIWGGISGDINTQQDLISTVLAFSIAL